MDDQLSAILKILRRYSRLIASLCDLSASKKAARRSKGSAVVGIIHISDDTLAPEGKTELLG